ncbi:MAG: ankyrin repeat domain-containing protein [gamma proteobacterium endosymbiont of Lamellibrachia anaximandri]|nr:ankyrin repeat domain-containing protein [gamma proteobacterium endosymbiont of Lamellibrachia anaximandri]MBL3534528.1 ankyrin repeat domain-containing protein [gamma proteobacterium endosymbiont of Lamellibrachia anaximandri]
MTNNERLFEACESGHLNEVMSLIAPRFLFFSLSPTVQINITDKDGNAPLHIASKNGHNTIVKILIDKGADVNRTNKNGDTPLNWALIKGHDDIAEFIIGKGADINAVNKHANPPLHKALEFKRRNIAELLINKGADVNAVDRNGKTALLWASMHGFEDIVKLVLQEGADLNTSDKYGNTPVYMASRGGHKNIENHLVNKGAVVESKIKDAVEEEMPLPNEHNSGGDVFMMPIEDGLFGACRVIRRGDPAKRHLNDWMEVTENGVLVTLTAWMGTSQPDISEPKLREPLRKTFGNWNGETELIWVTKPLPAEFKCIGKLQPTAEELKLNSNENSGWYWLLDMVSEQCKCEKESKKGDATKIDPNIKETVITEYLDETLFYASEGGNLAEITAALHGGANSNAHNGINTALMMAARNGHIEALKLLLDAGADPNITNSAGDTALRWAGENSDVTEILQDVTDLTKGKSIFEFPLMKQ